MQPLQLLHKPMARVQRNAAPFPRPAGQCLRRHGEELVKHRGQLGRVEFLGRGGGGEREEFAGGREAADGAGAVVEGEDWEGDCHLVGVDLLCLGLKEESSA